MLTGTLPWVLAATALGLAVASPPSPGVSDIPDNRFDLVTGWYKLDTDQVALLSWAADGGLRLFGLEGEIFSQRFDSLAENSFRWLAVRDEPEREASFVFDDHGEVTGFSWTDQAGHAGLATRLDAYGYRVLELHYRNGEVRLSGTMLLPRSDQLTAAAVIIHGSGDSDRNNLWYMLIAHHLAGQGIAVLLPDKRGCGKSNGEWRTASFEDFGRDTLAGVEATQATQGIDPKRVGLLGISQGGWIAPLAASITRDLAFVINVSGTTVTPNEQLLHESRRNVRDMGFPELTEGAMAPVAAWIAKQRRPVWWNKNGDFDPLPYWEGLALPALIVYGAEDEEDNVPVARSVELVQEIERQGTKTEFTIKVYPDSGHDLFLPETKTIRPDFLHLLSEWIGEKTAG